MNNLFEISGDEIKRILSLHEESTKQQYLNVLNEQINDFIVTPENLQLSSGDSKQNIPKGIKFFYDNRGQLYTNTFGKSEKLMRVIYFCNTGKFQFFSSNFGQINITNYKYDIKYPVNFETKLYNVCKNKGFRSDQQTTTTTTKSPVQQKPVTRQTPQQFAQQVKTYNTQIQTSLGSQKPTGQITDADLDNILTKLG